MPGFAFSGESRYLPRLQVYVNGDHKVTDLELGVDKVDPNYQKTQDLEVGTDRIDPVYKNIQDKIEAVLKLLTFREQHVMVQFWSPYEAGKRHVLTTIDQPFGVGVIDHPGLGSYRRDSEGRSFVLDKDHEEDDCSPVVRVFRQGLPEWTSDVTSYLPKHFVQQVCAIRCNLHGYLALPVFYSNTRLRVGVLELLTASKYRSYAYEVQQIHKALETVDLRTQQAFDCPPLNVPNERRQKDFDIIRGILKTMCDNYSLPLAQTWTLSQHSSFVSHEKVIQKSCSSFDTRCVGKVCMSRAALPFHVQDLSMWSFLKACRERHLDRSRGFIGKALLSRGSCFCEDVTKLSDEEYPLVHHARMNRLTSCFTIFLHSLEANDDYVLEFFLPPDIKDSVQVLNLVQTLKQNIPIGSGFELGDSSSIQVVGPPTEVGKSVSIDPHTIQISSVTTTKNDKSETVTSDSESIMVHVADKTEASAIVSSPSPLNQIYVDKSSDIITGTDNLTGDDFAQNSINVVGVRENNRMISYPNVVSMQKTSINITDAGEKNKRLKQGRKRKIDSLTMETVEKHFGKSIDQASNSLGVSRSTLKRFCREHDMPSWPLPTQGKKTVHITDLKRSQKLQPKRKLQQPSNKRFGLAFAVFLMVRVKRWSCSIKSHEFSGKWWSCGKHSYLPSKSDSIYQTARLFVHLRRWRKKSSMRNAALRNGDHPAVSKNTAKPKQNVTKISEEIKMVTVKATFKEDMIKFTFPTSSGLLELEQEVARRIKLKSRRPCLKYMDEDNDLIIVACDADLKLLFELTTNYSTIKLIITADDWL